MARRTAVRIDMTPMVDVAFLLLIFFMSTTQFKPPEVVAVKLPVSTSDVLIPETNTIILTVNREGRFFISSEKASDAVEVSKEQLFEAVVSWRTRNPSAVVLLKGDREADFGAVADMMDVLADSKTLRFNLMTDLKKKPRAAAEAPQASAAPALPSVPSGERAG